MSPEAITLIVGSDSFIGGALMAQLCEDGKRVAGTTKRHETLDQSHLYLDLSKDVETWNCPRSVSVAIICAGVTRIVACRRDPIKSAQVNVDGTAALIKNLVSKGVFVLYLSTDKVFDGSKPHRLPDDELSPITEYGRQKAEAECQIKQLNSSASILRLSKVLDKEDPLFQKWILEMRQQKAIHPFHDMMLAPVPISTVVSAIQSIVEKRMNGIMQLSGDCDISYSEAATLGVESIGLDENLIKPISASEAGFISEELSKNTTMDMQRLRNELGIKSPDVKETIKANFKDIMSSFGDLNSIKP